MTTPFDNNRWLEGEDQEAQRRQQRLDDAPFVSAKDIPVGQQFRLKHLGIYTRVDPSWHDPEHVFGVGGQRLVRVDTDDKVQTVPA